MTVPVQAAVDCADETGGHRSSGPFPESPRHRFSLGLLGIGTGGLVVRLLYVFHISRDIPLVGDPGNYHTLGHQIAAGEGYLRWPLFEATGEKLPTAWFPPGFPSVLAVLDGLGVDTVTGQRVVTAGLGTATVIVIGLIGRQVAGPMVGLLAAGVAAVAPMLVVADGSLGVETLYGLIVALLVLLVYRRAGPDQPPSWPWWAALGAVVAVAAYVRGEGVLLLVFLVVPLAFRWPGSWRVRLTRLGVATGALVLVLAPWTIRNYAAFDGVVLISNNGTGVFGGANCPVTYYGEQRGRYANACIASTVDARGRPVSELAFAARGRRAGIDFALENAAALPATAAVRVLRTWGLYDSSAQIAGPEFRIHGEAYQDSKDPTWLRWGHRLHLALMVMAAVGSGAALRERLRVWPLWSLVAMVTVVSALSYGRFRFLAAAVPAVMVLAALGLVYLWRAARARTWSVAVVGEAPSGPRAPTRVRRRVVAGVVVVAAAVVVTPRWRAWESGLRARWWTASTVTLPARRWVRPTAWTGGSRSAAGGRPRRAGPGWWTRRCGRRRCRWSTPGLPKGGWW
jgi:hypothetical protein